MCTIDGSRCHLGDSKVIQILVMYLSHNFQVPFCLQSVSKAFNYAAVSTDIGYEAIHKYIGHEPSGRLFNEICLDSESELADQLCRYLLITSFYFVDRFAKNITLITKPWVVPNSSSRTETVRARVIWRESDVISPFSETAQSHDQRGCDNRDVTDQVRVKLSE